jgi:hypothetical protein
MVLDITGIDDPVRERLHKTKGGESETELKELAVNPTSAPSASRAVMMVTPVAKLPKASRNSRVEKSGASG